MSEFKEAIKDYETLRKEMEKAKKEALKPARAALAADFKAALEKHPDVKRVYWQQYTPYFNDGDACTFSVYEPYVETDDDDENWDHPVLKKLPRPDRHEHIMKDLFGDGSQVSFRRGASDFEVEDCEHD